MLKQIGFFFLGLVFLALGVVGVLVPVLPGFLFFILAIGCFSMFSPALRRRLHAHPRFKRAHNRWVAGEHLSLGDRVRLGFWLSADAMFGKR